MLRTTLLVLCCSFAFTSIGWADDPDPTESSRGKSPAGNESNYKPPYYLFLPPAGSMLFDKRMGQTALLPAVYIENLCKVRYRATTQSPECQKFIDQGLGYFYSYVWMEAARSFETALTYDPDCAFAWLGLSRSFDKWQKTSKANKALEMAKSLMDKAGQREQLLITAKLQEKGMLPGVAPEERKKKAAQTLDELLTLYDDDEEGWFARGQLNGWTEGAVYYKALLTHNPIHPGASHELVHFFENFKRPALGWPYALAYMESSPKIPHAWHMQAHLAMRIGKWDHTCDWSVKALELAREFHKVQGVNPTDDYQFTHHLEICMTSLLHDGRYAEAHSIQSEAEQLGYTYKPNALALSIAEQNWDEALRLIQKNRKGDKGQLSYNLALLYLTQGDSARAGIEIEVLQNYQRARKNDRETEIRLNVVQGWYLCQTGLGDIGCKMFRRAVEKTKDDFGSHSWGHGADIMVLWGIAALQSGDAAEAEEAFQEALAHDAGSAKAAFGLFALCNKLGRAEEAERYMKVARRCWARADDIVFERTREAMNAYAANLKRKSAAVAAEQSPAKIGNTESAAQP